LIQDHKEQDFTAKDKLLMKDPYQKTIAKTTAKYLELDFLKQSVQSLDYDRNGRRLETKFE